MGAAPCDYETTGFVGLIANLHVPGGEPSAQKRKAEELEAAEYQQAGAAEGPGRHKQVGSVMCPMSRHSTVDSTVVFSTLSLGRHACASIDQCRKHYVMLTISGQCPYDQDLLFVVHCRASHQQQSSCWSYTLECC